MVLGFWGCLPVFGVLSLPDFGALPIFGVSSPFLGFSLLFLCSQFWELSPWFWGCLSPHFWSSLPIFRFLSPFFGFSVFGVVSFLDFCLSPFVGFSPIFGFLSPFLGFSPFFCVLHFWGCLPGFGVLSLPIFGVFPPFLGSLTLLSPPALQLPLVSEGGRGGTPESPQPAPPPRPRQMLGLPPPPYLVPRSLESIEIDQKLQEIMKQTGYLTVGGQRYQAEINDLENLGEIGSGTCGQVWKMRFRKTGHVIAVKQMRRSGNREENKRILMDLDVVLKSHDCPYIVQCFGTFITNTDVFIAMELMGTCAEKLKKRIQGPIPERILGKMTVAIVKALLYLKEKHGVIHRDVKPSNILLDERGQVKLCDFGISGRLVDSKAKTRSAGCAAYMAVRGHWGHWGHWDSPQSMGCAAYMAPERIDPPDPTKPDYDIRADVWSLGISLVELATGQFPYQNCKTDFEVLTKVLQEDPPLLPPAMGFSGDFQAFVRDCLTKDHRKRPKYNKLLEHTFIKRYETLEVDVATWFKDVMARTESPRPGGGLGHHLPFFTR
uniref:mitogen-activated protein kinase kinase n=1 Tax=Taeniopygia guttata TaxID=59729 RepID=A0A674HD17_TAEGU